MVRSANPFAKSHSPRFDGGPLLQHVRPEVLLNEDHRRNPADGGREAPCWQTSDREAIMKSRFYCIAILMLYPALSGCVESSHENAAVSTKDATPVAFNATGAPTVEFAVPDMMCEDGCLPVVKEILAQQPGAQDVAVDFTGKTATVAIDEATFDAQQAIAELVDNGFDHSRLVNDEPTAAPQSAEAADSGSAPSM